MLVADEKLMKPLIEELLMKSSVEYPKDCLELLMKQGYEKEKVPQSKFQLKIILDNLEVAKEKRVALCQTPGFCHLLQVRVGSNAKLDCDPGIFYKEAVKKATAEGIVRASIVHPLTRQNTNDNTGVGIPIIELTIVPGANHIEVIASQPVGIGFATGFTPAETTPQGEFIRKLVLDTLSMYRMYCPPFFIGVGIGGTIDQATTLARDAILRTPIYEPNPDPGLAELEKQILEDANQLGIGTMNVGGKVTALIANVNLAYTHIALMNVAVYVQCWAIHKAAATIEPNGRITHK